jgi:hypothetical protein
MTKESGWRALVNIWNDCGQHLAIPSASSAIVEVKMSTLSSIVLRNISIISGGRIVGIAAFIESVFDLPFLALRVQNLF